MRRTRYRRARRTRRTGRRRTFGRPLRNRQKGFVQTAGYYGRYRSTANPLAFQKNHSKELKFHDTNQVDASILATAFTLQSTLCDVAQNTSESGRIGRNIVVKKVMFKGHLHLDVDEGTGANIGGHDICRLIVYLDKQTNGTVAQVTDILEFVGSGSHNSFRNLANSKRFVMLMDKRYVLNTNSTSGEGTTASTQEKMLNLEWYINVNVPIEFDSTSGSVSEMKSNNIGVLAVSRHGTIRIEGEYRIRYYG